MAIRVRVDVHPGGYAARPCRLLDINIHSQRMESGHWGHVYHAYTHDNKSWDGWVSKRYSGHRNIIHLLRHICRSIIDESHLHADNYITTPED